MNDEGSDIILARLMRLHPKIIDLTLDRMHRLLAALGHPERALAPVIHLAGTNGKGSTQAMIRAGLEAGGARVHAYTSPHLARFHERIRLAGDLIADDHLERVLDRCEAANGDAPITYFEITTAAAFLAFAETPADYVLLETGLGGRLDATNVIERPAMCVITPVSIDHTQYLGETLAEIAGEKAGILKRRVPCVVAAQQDGALEVIEARADRLGAPLLVQNQHWRVWEEPGRLVYEDETGLLDLPPPVLIGAHQVQNAGAALATLRHLGADDTACEAAVTGADWPARMQHLRHGPLLDAAPGAEFWLDGGHNPACGAALAESLGRLPPRETHLICGMLNTKDVAGYLAPLAPLAASLTAISIPGEVNTLPADETRAHAARVGLSATTASGADAAVRRIAQANPHARILICGSLYLAGHVLREHG